MCLLEDPKMSFFLDFFHFSFIVRRMETMNKNPKEALLTFIERSEMDKHQEEYIQPDIVKTKKWNADQFGWPATCNGCGETSCIYGVRRDGCRFRKLA
jgi:hypothetical protein